VIYFKKPFSPLRMMEVPFLVLRITVVLPGIILSGVQSCSEYCWFLNCRDVSHPFADQVLEVYRDAISPDPIIDN